MGRVFMKGCEAMAEAAVRAGCRFFAGYPITPQNEIPEYMARRLPEVNGTFVQGESEVASISMVYGALTHTWPTAILNFGLTVIHIVKLIHMKRKSI